MRLWGALVLMFLAGCAGPEPARSTSWKEVLRAPLMNKDLVQIDVALLERPVGDRFINKEVWEFTDEQVVALDHKAALDDNGFRVGQIVGMPPGRLQTLLTSERSCRHPLRQLVPFGRPATLVLGPVLKHAVFQIQQNGQSQEITLDQVQFVLEVIASPTQEGRIRLHFIPKAQYGENLPDLRPARDGSNWSFQLSRPSKTFADLSWEVDLAANDFLVVSADFQEAPSLAYQAFVQDEGLNPVQRLLVVRTCRPGGRKNDK